MKPFSWYSKARVLYFFGRIYWRIFRPLSWGVRLLLIQNGTILLVWHTYQDGWYLPGGGVKRGETFQAAARREAREEVGATTGPMLFWGLYSNLRGYKSDHVVVFLCDDFQLNGRTDFEIAECRFFPLTNLPANLHEGTANRIQEYLAGNHQPTAGVW